MSIWVILQLAMNIVLGLGVWALWTKFKRPPKDDPRLSRGLQLLQSKIAVLEDLSDKTEVQVRQLTTLMDQKCREVHQKTQEASRQMEQIDRSMHKSMEVAQIFEDRIPHEEIIERQRTKKYVKAAQLAHQGYPLEEIARHVDMPMAELELVIKMNKDQLLFSAKDLPFWAQDHEVVPTAETVEAPQAPSTMNVEQAFQQKMAPPTSLEQLGDEFRKACEDMNKADEELPEEGLFAELEQTSQRAFEAVKNLSMEVSGETRQRISDVSSIVNETVSPILERAQESLPKNFKNSASSVIDEMTLRNAPVHEANEEPSWSASGLSFQGESAMTPEPKIDNPIVEKLKAIESKAIKERAKEERPKVRQVPEQETVAKKAKPIKAETKEQMVVRPVQFPRISSLDNLG